MSDVPFSPGGFIPSPGPESDLVPALLRSGEIIGIPHLVHSWLNSGMSLEDWLEQRKRGGDDGGDAG